jgi:hypothetical protein
MGEAKLKRQLALQSPELILMTHGADTQDQTWENDFGTFNVTRARGLAFGPYPVNFVDFYPHIAHLEFDPAYVASLTEEQLGRPIMLIEDDLSRWHLLDGRHRCERFHQLGYKTVQALMIAKQDRPKIEVSFSIFNEAGTRLLHTNRMDDAIAFMHRHKRHLMRVIR